MRIGDEARDEGPFRKGFSALILAVLVLATAASGTLAIAKNSGDLSQSLINLGRSDTIEYVKLSLLADVIEIRLGFKGRVVQIRRGVQGSFNRQPEAYAFYESGRFHFGLLSQRVRLRLPRPAQG